MKKLIDYLKTVLKTKRGERWIHRTHDLVRLLENVSEYEKSNYAFMMFGETTKEDVTIEIKFKKANQCSTNLPKITINGVDCDNPSYDLITMLRRAIEEYQMEKIQ